MSEQARSPWLTVGVFAVFAVVLWTNAIANHYRFNLVIALLGSTPVLVLLARVALLASGTRRAGLLAAAEHVSETD